MVQVFFKVRTTVKCERHRRNKYDISKQAQYDDLGLEYNLENAPN